MTKIDAIEFGKELKLLREKKKYCTKKLGTDIDKSTSYVYQIEKGLVRHIPEDNARKLLVKLGVKPKEVVDSILEKHKIGSKLQLESNVCLDKCYRFSFQTANLDIEVNACGADKESALSKALKVFQSKVKNEDWISVGCKEIAEEIYI